MAFNSKRYRDALESEIECLVRAHTALRRSAAADTAEGTRSHEAHARYQFRVAHEHRRARLQMVDESELTRPAHGLPLHTIQHKPNLETDE